MRGLLDAELLVKRDGGSIHQIGLHENHIGIPAKSLVLQEIYHWRYTIQKPCELRGAGRGNRVLNEVRGVCVAQLFQKLRQLLLLWYKMVLVRRKRLANRPCWHLQFRRIR